MYMVTKVIEFCYGHRLMDYEGKSKALHGHSAKLIVTLGTEMLDETGFVREFGEVKRTIKEWVDEPRLRCCHNMPALAIGRIT